MTWVLALSASPAPHRGLSTEVNQLSSLLTPLHTAESSLCIYSMVLLRIHVSPCDRDCEQLTTMCFFFFFLVLRYITYTTFLGLFWSQGQSCDRALTNGTDICSFPLLTHKTLLCMVFRDLSPFLSIGLLKAPAYQCVNDSMLPRTWSPRWDSDMRKEGEAVLQASECLQSLCYCHSADRN